MLKLADLEEVCGKVKKFEQMGNDKPEGYSYYFSQGDLKIRAHRIRESDRFWVVNWGANFKDDKGRKFEEFLSTNYVYTKEHLKNIITQLNPQNFENKPFSVNELIENLKISRPPYYPEAFNMESNLFFRVYTEFIDNTNFFLCPQEYFSFFEKTNWYLIRKTFVTKTAAINLTNPKLVTNIFFY